MARLIQFCTSASLYDGPFDSVHGWSAAGMGYLLVTDGGRLIMIDGGFDEDAETLLSLMKSATGQETPTVDLWIVTHPHGDHYYALRRLAGEDMRCKLSVKRLAYRFPADFTDRGGNTCLGDAREMRRVADVFGAEAITPEVDEHISIDGLDLHFLYVPYDVSGLNNFNQLSLIFRITGSEQSVMITGDAFHKSLNEVTVRYGSSLRSDILQMPHHGLCDTGHLGFYGHVGAETLLIPTSIAGDRAMHSDLYGIDSRRANLFAEEQADKVYKAFEDTVEIKI